MARDDKKGWLKTAADIADMKMPARGLWKHKKRQTVHIGHAMDPEDRTSKMKCPKHWEFGQ